MHCASKYEEVIPLLMKTILNKIGHDKFTLSQVQEKEMEILKAIEYKVGAPTVLEFIDRYCEELADILPKSPKFHKVCVYLAKMACHSYDL